MRIDIKQLEFIHPILREITIWLEKETGLEFTITSLYRINDSGVHGTLLLRGIDLRMRNSVVGKQIETLINDIWVYDVNRPKLKCALLHGYVLHLHLQVCDETKGDYHG